MAGGTFAQTVLCMHCMMKNDEIKPAERTSEGLEEDHYECEMGHEFSIPWSTQEGGAPPPQIPQWPPTEEFLTMFNKMSEAKKKRPLN